MRSLTRNCAHLQILVSIFAQMLYSSAVRLILPYILDRGSSYGQYSDIGKTSPSQTTSAKRRPSSFLPKPCQSVSCRTPTKIVGAYLSKFYKAMCWDVLNRNHLWDWGSNPAYSLSIARIAAQGRCLSATHLDVDESLR